MNLLNVIMQHHMKNGERNNKPSTTLRLTDKNNNNSSTTFRMTDNKSNKHSTTLGMKGRNKSWFDYALHDIKKTK